MDFLRSKSWKKGQIFPTFGIRILHISMALSSQMQCLWSLLTTLPRSSGTPFSGLQRMLFPTPRLCVPGDTTRWCTFAGGPDSKVGMKNGESLFFSILKFIMTLFFSQLPWAYWFQLLLSIKFPLSSEASLVINCSAFFSLAVLLEFLPPLVPNWDLCSSMDLPLRVQTQVGLLSPVVFPIWLQTWEREKEVSDCRTMSLFMKSPKSVCMLVSIMVISRWLM